MSALKTTLNPFKWWIQFPSALRLITRARFLYSIGAGGVIYLTPLVFNKLDFTATQIGSGLAAAAFAGTIARFVSGRSLDKGTNCSWLLRSAAIISILADMQLIKAQNYNEFLLGELLIGIATGLYWPAIELAVSIACNRIPSSKGFALARSADALGVGLGALLGSLTASIGIIRMVYIINSSCMLTLILSLAKSRFIPINMQSIVNYNNSNQKYLLSRINESFAWLSPLIPILMISILATGILTLLQSTLPLDLVRGGISRPPLSEGNSSGLVALHLLLLIIIQWPIGRWLVNHNIKFGLMLSLGSFSLGCFLLGISTLFSKGVIIVIFSQIPIAFGLSAFLPTATEAIIQK